MHRATAVAFFVLLALVSAQAVLLVKAQSQSAELLRWHKKRRAFCRWYDSAIRATREELVDPELQASAAARHAWLTSPPFLEICEVE
jgi:hypothetical protein